MDFSLLSPPFIISPTMSQFTSRLDKFRAMADAGANHRAAVRRRFKDATDRLEVLEKTMPDDKDELREDQVLWMDEFGRAMVSGPPTPKFLRADR